jgi:hypothetical protein
MELNVVNVSEEKVKVGYECTCGCRPKVRFEQGAPAVESRCCCGLSFVVGSGGEVSFGKGVSEERVTRTSFDAPWGESVPAIWVQPDPVQQLKTLAELQASGVLTDDEFR